MAKRQHIVKNEVTIDEFSGYGTALTWVIQEVGSVTVDGETYSDVVIAEDNKGFYTTSMSYVRGNVLDPYRCYRRTFLGDAKQLMEASDKGLASE